MKNWRTTISGILLGLYPIIDSLMDAYQKGYFEGKKGFQLFAGIAIIILGVVAHDPKKELKQ
jgi:hypothetical protein